MVAWELGAIEEKAEHADEATKWYTIAAQRFRRSDWKKKAEEALTRLGAPLLAERSEPSAQEHIPEEQTEQGESLPETEAASIVAAPPELEADYEPQTKFFGSAHLDQRREDRVSSESGEATAPRVHTGAATQQSSPSGAEDAGRRRRRRGRRGGRGRRRGGAVGQPGLPAQTYTPSPNVSMEPPPAEAPREREEDRGTPEQVAPQPAAREEAAEPVARPAGQDAAPRLPSERMAHGRAGDPALASRTNHLESLLRRLLGSALHRLGEAEEAPAGPGVFLLSDSDQTTSYYVESCQTLRVAIANLVRGRGGKGRPGGRGFVEVDLKEKLAEHLGITESKVGDYLRNHCVVRWIQLDDEAPNLAHFAIAVLRTPLNL